MSLGAVFGAADGALVVVDGLKTESDPGARDGLRVVNRTERKFALSRDRAAIAVTTGQASFAGRPIWEWVEAAMDGAEERGNAQSDTRAFVRSVVYELEQVQAMDEHNRQKQGRSTGKGIQGFLCEVANRGYGRADAEVWTFDIDPDRTTGPSQVMRFGETQATSIALCPDRPQFLSPSEELERLPAELLRATLEREEFQFNDMSVAQVHAVVAECMAAFVADESDSLGRHGVGGTWSVVELQNQEPARISEYLWDPSD